MANRRLTHLQLFRLVKNRLDEAGTARWDKAQVAQMLNMAYADWLKGYADRELEKDEAARRELGPLTITSKPIVLTDFSLSRDKLNPELYRIIAISASWQRTLTDRCTRKRTVRTDTWPVTPIRHDQLAAARTDPWNQPGDDNARYSESRHEEDPDRVETLTIHCETQPGSLVVTYVHEPAVIDILSSPDSKTEVGYDIQLELVRRAVALLQTPNENYPAMQAAYGELQTVN